MTWFRVDDGFPEHPKLEELEAEPRLYMAAITVWTIMGADCARRLTDGYVSKSRLEKVLCRLGKHAVDGASALVRCGLWHEDDGGWVYHDWHDYQPTKQSVEAARKQKTDRQRRWRDARVDASTAPPTAPSTAPFVDASRDASEGSAHARVSRPVPSRPVPDQESERARVSAPPPRPAPVDRLPEPEPGFTASRMRIEFQREWEAVQKTCPNMGGRNVSELHALVHRTAELQKSDPEHLFITAVRRWLAKPLTDRERQSPYACFMQAWGSMTARGPVQAPEGSPETVESLQRAAVDASLRGDDDEMRRLVAKREALKDSLERRGARYAR